MNQLYDRYLGPKWREEPADPTLWGRAQAIPAGELWRTHERRRERLVGFARERLRAQLCNRGAPQTVVNEAEEALSPDLRFGFQVIKSINSRFRFGTPSLWLAPHPL